MLFVPLLYLLTKLDTQISIEMSWTRFFIYC
jgi:hypothetical protein